MDKKKTTSEDVDGWIDWIYNVYADLFRITMERFER